MSPRLIPGRAFTGIRRLTARHRWTRWVPVTTCGVAVVLAVHAHEEASEAARTAWGERSSVWIAAGDIAPGTPIDATVVEFPLIAVPTGAASTGDDVTGRIARQRIVEGAVVTEVDVGGADALSLLPVDWRSVPVIESAPSGASVGDRVDVVSEGIVLVEGGIVLVADSDAALLGVPADVAPLVALANDAGVTLLRNGLSGFDVAEPDGR